MALDDVKMTYQTITNTHKFSMRWAQTAIFSRRCQGFVKVDPEAFWKNRTLYLSSWLCVVFLYQKNGKSHSLRKTLLLLWQKITQSVPLWRYQTIWTICLSFSKTRTCKDFQANQNAWYCRTGRKRSKNWIHKTTHEVLLFGQGFNISQQTHNASTRATTTPTMVS